MSRETEPAARRPFDAMSIAGILLGASIPALSFGSGAFAACFGLACLLALTIPSRSETARWGWSLLKGPVGLFAALTLAWWMASAAVSLDPLSSFEVIGRMVILLGFAGWLALVLATRSDARRLAESVLLLGSALLFWVAMIASYVFHDLLPVFAPFTDEWINPREIFKSFAAAIALVLPVILWIGWRHGGAWRAVAFGAMVPAALLLWGHGEQPARASIVGILGGGALVCLLLLAARLSVRGRLILLGVVCVSGLGAIAWIIGGLPPAPFEDDAIVVASLPFVDLHRQVIWGFVLQKIGEAPMLGHGINTINLTDGASLLIPGLNQQYVPGHPHNWMLEIASETGVPGFLFFATTLALLFITLAFTVTGKGRAVRGAGLVAMAVLGVFWTASMANFSIWSIWWQGALLATLTLPVAALLDGAWRR